MHRQYSQSFALEATVGFGIVEFTIFPDREEVMVQRYGLRVADGTSWYAPSEREGMVSKEQARTLWSELEREGYQRRSEKSL